MANEQETLSEWSPSGPVTRSRLSTLSIPLLPVAPINPHLPSEAVHGLPSNAPSDFFPPISPETALSPASDAGSSIHTGAAGTVASLTAAVASSDNQSSRPTKRKRSRVTPQQLTQLERAFAMDRSPTAARRKELSEQLGMQERQTQIWFQNRRAKAKLLQQRARSTRLEQERNGASPPLSSPSSRSMGGVDFDLQALLHEVEAISVIPCTDLSIGTWRRISANRYDLVAYACETRNTLVWYIHSAGSGYKMEIPYEDMQVKHVTEEVSPGANRAILILNKPPSFFREVDAPSASHSGSSLVFPSMSSSSSVPDKIWSPCADWTEGQQATHCLRHEIVGPGAALVQALRALPGAPLTVGPHPPSIPASPAQAYSPPHASSSSRHGSPSTSILPPVLPTPLAFARAPHLSHTRQRSRSHPVTPPTGIATFDTGSYMSRTPFSAGMVHDGRFSHQQQRRPTAPGPGEYASYYDSTLSSPTISRHGSSGLGLGHNHSTSLGDGSTIPISRSFSIATGGPPSVSSATSSTFDINDPSADFTSGTGVNTFSMFDLNPSALHHHQQHNNNMTPPSHHRIHSNASTHLTTPSEHSFALDSSPYDVMRTKSTTSSPASDMHHSATMAMDVEPQQQQQQHPRNGNGLSSIYGGGIMFPGSSRGGAGGDFEMSDGGSSLQFDTTVPAMTGSRPSSSAGQELRYFDTR